MQRRYFDNSVEDSIQKKFRGKDELTANFDLSLFAGAERAYGRLLNGYVNDVNKIVLRYLPEVRRGYIAESMFRVDSKAGLKNQTEAVLKKIREDVKKLYKGNKYQKELRKIGKYEIFGISRKWKHKIEKTFGVTVDETYYVGTVTEKELEKWISNNVALINGIPEQYLKRIEKAVLKGYENHKNTVQITNDLKKEFGMTKRRAKLIARDQVFKLNSDIAEKIQRDAGCDRFKWSTCKDNRVRESHRKLEGKRFYWNNLPMNEKGERIKPASEVQCRCVAIPVFNRKKIKFPLK